MEVLFCIFCIVFFNPRIKDRLDRLSTKARDSHLAINHDYSPLGGNPVFQGHEDIIITITQGIIIVVVFLVKLNFDGHISNICKKSNNQLNAICRLENYIGSKELKTLVKKKGLNEIEGIPERYLRLLLNDYQNDYSQLLKISEQPTMEIKCLRILATEIF